MLKSRGWKGVEELNEKTNCNKTFEIKLWKKSGNVLIVALIF